MTRAALLLLVAAGASAQPVRVGSKAFTESVVLGEMATQLARASGARALHRRELGGTRVLWEALVRGDVDAYPEYTGTLRQELFAGQDVASDADLQSALARAGVEMLAPLGFNDTYALGMAEARAEALGVETLSDLRSHPGLALGVSNEFLDRADGWPGVRRAYRLPQTGVQGLDHDLALRALAAGRIDATDLYTTDAEVAAGGIRVLRDDRGFFPRYDAVFLIRRDLRTRAPAAVAAIERLGGQIDEAAMIRLNARARLGGASEAAVARDALAGLLGVTTEARVATRVERVWRRTREHLVLVGVSLLCAVLVAVPLGIAPPACARSRRPCSAPSRSRTRFRRSRCSSCSSPCSASGRRRPSWRSFSTRSCRSCATRTPGSSASRPSSWRAPRRWACRRSRASSGSTCRSRFRASSPAFRRAPS